MLRHREDALELRVNGVFVMDTVETSTEIALATAALSVVAEPRRVLVGGLGLGFTAAAVLADSRVEELVVVEIEPAVIEWMRDGTVPHGPALFADERLRVVSGDVATCLTDGFDLILLDVDNGPGYLVHDQNAAVYAEPFLARCRDALAVGGRLVIWSADRAPKLAADLSVVFGSGAESSYGVRLQGRDEKYWLYTAPSGDAAASNVGA